MDDDTIDLSHLTEEDRREYMRRISQLTSCPCVNCTADCLRWENIASCEPYQDWKERNQTIRGRGRPVKR